MLQFENVSVEKNKQQIIKDVTFSLKPHTITVLLGRNASGKTTLISCLTNESRYTGKIYFGDRDLIMLTDKSRAQLISVLPQSLPAAPVTVENLVKMGRNPYLDIGKNLSEKDKDQVENAILSVGIENIRHKKLSEISGGEKQKAYIAMVLSQNTRVVAMDEPTTYMDIQHEKEFISLIKELRDKHKKTLFVVMHNLDKAVEIADNIAVLHEGRLVSFGDCETVVESGIVDEVFGVKRHEVFIDGKKSIIFR